MNQVLPKEKVFIGGIKRIHTEQDLRSYFSSFGEIKEISIIMDRETKNNKGVAFVTFTTLSAAKQVVQKEMHELEGVFVQTKFAGNREQMQLIKQFNQRNKFFYPTTYNSSRRFSDDYNTHVRRENLVNEIATEVAYLLRIRNLDENQRNAASRGNQSTSRHMTASYQRPSQVNGNIGNWRATQMQVAGNSSSFGMWNPIGLQVSSQSIAGNNSGNWQVPSVRQNLGRNTTNFPMQFSAAQSWQRNAAPWQTRYKF